MSSSFDTAVRNRREHTPWARISLSAFLREAAWNGAPTKAGEEARSASISVAYRGDVASRLWWTVRWVGEDGEEHRAEAQELELALWRASEIELWHRKPPAGATVPNGLPGEIGPAGSTPRFFGPDVPFQGPSEPNAPGVASP
jgi:hypothetical protein